MRALIEKDAPETLASEEDPAHPNPFAVLGLPVTAGVREIEREGQRQLAMIGAGVADDSSPEAEHRVRQALDELRDGRRRLAHEIRSPNWTFDGVARRELMERLEVLGKALPSATPSSYALAEALLWETVQWPGPFALAPNHADERGRAFTDDPAVVADASLGQALDYGELVAFHPPTRAPSTRAARREAASKKGT